MIVNLTSDDQPIHLEGNAPRSGRMIIFVFLVEPDYVQAAEKMDERIIVKRLALGLSA